METFRLLAGASLPLSVTLGDGSGLPIAYPAPGPALEADLWPGGTRSASFPVAASWVDPAAGSVRLLLAADQTAALSSGRYYGRLALADPDLGRVVAYEWAVDVETAAGDKPEPPTYCTNDDLRGLARGWIGEAQEPEDGAGFARERNQAYDWLNRLIAAGTPVRLGGGRLACGFGRYPGRGPFGPRLRALLDAGGLVIRPWVVQATARKAAALVCLGQLGTADDARWVERYAFLSNLAQMDALAAVAEIAETPGGPPTFGVALGNGSLR